MPDKILAEIGKELPTASVNRMVIGKTSVDVELLVKDQLDEQLIGTWFNNEKIGDLLKLVVVLSKSQEATKILSLGSDAVSLCDKTVGKIERESLAEEVVRLTNPKLLTGSRRGLSTEKNRILNLIDRNTEVKILNLSKDYKGSVDDIIRSEKEDIDGIEVSNIYYEKKYDISPAEDHVSIFSYVKMDVRDFGERFSIDTSKAGIDSFNGEVSSEKVITSGMIVRKSRVFLDKGKIYNGPVRYSFRHGRYLADSQGDQNTKLETRVIRNPKIVDEREIMSVSSIRSEFDNLSLSIVEGSKVSRDNMETKTIPSYFSPLYHSKDEDDNVRFMFSINTSEILIRNSVYGPLFSKLSFSKKQDILERSLIKNVEVRRVRVKKSSISENKLNTGQTKGEAFDKNDPPIILCRTGEKEPRSLVPVSGEIASFSEEDTFLRFNSGDITMRTFSGIDKTFSSISDGFYQYEAEVELSDTIREYLMEQISELKTAAANLKEYHNFGILISPTLEKAEVSNPHIDLDVEAGSSESPDKSHYEAYSNKFTRRFLRVAREKYGTPENYPWVAIPPVMVDLVSGFVSNFPEDKKAQIVSSMRHSMSPLTGNPTNILSIIKMLESFTKKVEDLAALPSKPSVSASTSTSSTNKEVKGTSKSPTKSFTAKKRFEETFNSNNTRSFGFNYFDPDIGSDSDLGLKKLTNFDYESRVDQETERFFTDKDVDINPRVGGNTTTRRSSIADASYGYLTPTSFIDKRVVYDFTNTRMRSTSRRFRRRTISQNSKINTFSFLLERIVTNSKAKDVLDRNNIFSDDFNVTIAPIGRKDFSYYPDQKRHRRVSTSNLQEQVSVIELYDYIAKEKSAEPSDRSRSSFLRGNAGRNKSGGVSNPFRVAEIVSNSGNSFTIKTLEGNTRTISHFSYLRLPNQVKSLYLRKSQNNHDIVTGEFLEGMYKNYNFDGELEYRFTIGKLSRIKYLVGYRRTRRGELSAKSPIWGTLNKRTYDRLAGKSILCMIDPYENRSFDYSQTPGLHANVYNKYFILDIQRDTDVSDLERGISDQDIDATEEARGQTLTQGRRDDIAAAEGDTPTAERDTRMAGSVTSDMDTQSRRDITDMTPQEILGLDLRKYSDDDISKLNALQLASVPLSRRNRLSRKRTRVSRNNLMCVSLSEEKESQEFANASVRTSIVPRRSMRKTDNDQELKKSTQSGDVY